MFSTLECVFMAANCIASTAAYASLLLLDSSALGAACIEYEDVTLIVLIVRIYILPVVCIFKMGIDACRSYGDIVDATSLTVFIYLQLYYCLMPAYIRKECHEFFLTHHSWPSLLALVLAMLIDITRVLYHLSKACFYRKRQVRMETQSDVDEKNDTAALLPSTQSDIDELLEELDDMQ
jgi:hypothetical protein